MRSSASREKYIRHWVIGSMIVLGTLVFFNLLPLETQNSVISVLFQRPTTSLGYLVADLFVVSVLFFLVGFHLYILFECGFAKGLRRQGAWLLFIVIVPILSSYIYYWAIRYRGGQDKTSTL